MKKKKGFFDDVDEPEISENGATVSDGGDENAENVSTAEETVENTFVSETVEKNKDTACSCKKRNAIVFSLVAVVICAFIFTSVAYALGIFNDKYSEEPDSGK